MQRILIVAASLLVTVSLFLLPAVAVAGLPAPPLPPPPPLLLPPPPPVVVVPAERSDRREVRHGKKHKKHGHKHEDHGRSRHHSDD